MARFDVFQLRSDGSFVLDCQADVLRRFPTRFVVPLLPESDAPKAISRLNPVFSVNGRRYAMMTQIAAAIEVSELGPLVTSLTEQETTIGNALDMLLTGV